MKDVRHITRLLVLGLGLLLLFGKVNGQHIKKNFSLKLPDREVEGTLKYTYSIVAPELMPLPGGVLDIAKLRSPGQTVLNLLLHSCELTDSVYSVDYFEILSHQAPISFETDEKTEKQVYYLFKGGNKGKSPFSVTLSLELSAQEGGKNTKSQESITLSLPFIIENTSEAEAETVVEAPAGTEDTSATPVEDDRQVEPNEKAESSEKQPDPQAQKESEIPNASTAQTESPSEVEKESRTAILDDPSLGSPEIDSITVIDNGPPPDHEFESSPDLSLNLLGRWQFWVAVLLLGFILAFLISSGRKRAHKSNLHSSRAIKMTSHTSGNSSPPVRKSQVKFKQRNKANPNQHSGTYPPLKEEANTKGNDPQFLETISSDSSYLSLDMSQTWEESAIGQVFISASAMDGLEEFLAKQAQDHFEEDQRGLPEIGGFFMGKYALDGQLDQFNVALEHFIPITPEDHNVYKLEFGMEAYEALADAQDTYADMETLAWFHTHPGHGLFLSQPDLKIHDGFFKKRFQMAIEIDPLTEGEDMAIFTRQRNGIMNNNRDLIPGKTWFKWNEVKNGSKPSDP